MRPDQPITDLPPRIPDQLATVLAPQKTGSARQRPHLAEHPTNPPPSSPRMRSDLPVNFLALQETRPARHRPRPTRDPTSPSRPRPARDPTSPPPSSPRRRPDQPATVLVLQAARHVQPLQETKRLARHRQFQARRSSNLSRFKELDRRARHPPEEGTTKQPAMDLRQPARDKTADHGGSPQGRHPNLSSLPTAQPGSRTTSGLELPTNQTASNLDRRLANQTGRVQQQERRPVHLQPEERDACLRRAI